MTTETTSPQFDTYACQGDTISWAAEGFDLEARLEYDTDSNPEDVECYSPEDVQRWKNDEWFYVGVVLSVSRNGVKLLKHAASVWGVECNFNNTSNTYLAEVAQELQSEAIANARRELFRVREALKD